VEADEQDHTIGERPLTGAARAVMLIYAGLGLAAGTALFLGSAQTDTYFAWTIKVPLTAAFLGANYWSTCLFYLLTSRERTYSRARIALASGMVFTSLMLLATLLELDRFHLGSGGLFARFMGWAWLTVYISVPPLTIALLAYQQRLPGSDAPRRNRLEPRLRGTLAAQAAVMVVLGIGLLGAPGAFDNAWPWPLTSLTARATGAWLVGIGFAAAQTAWENDLLRVRWVFVSFTALGVLHAVALVRYPHSVDWGGAATWLYVAFLATLLVVGVVGLARALKVAPTASDRVPASS
jgi:hypothetical protein